MTQKTNSFTLAMRKLILALAPIALFVPQNANAQIATSWIPGNGLWSDGAKWTNGLPNSANADAYVDNQPGTNSLVTMGSGFSNVGYAVTLGRLRIDTGDRVELSEVSTSLTMDGSAFAGAGEILINGTLFLPGSVGGGGGANQLMGTKVINGSGKLLLGQPGRRPEILGNTTNNAIIEGAATFGRSNSGGNAFPIFNTGLVNGNITGEALEFATSGATNTAAMQATNGATLRFSQGNITNSATGLITANGTGTPASSTVLEFGGRFLTSGGNLSATNGGLLRITGEATWKDLIVTGPTQANGVLSMDGTVTNNGVITVNTPQARIETPYNPGFTVTVAGTGEIILDKPASRNDTAFGDTSTSWLIQDQKVHGRGSMGRNSSGSSAIQIKNQGTIQADVPNQELELALGGLDNQSGGVLRAQNNGVLTLGISGPVLNTGGTIEALTGGQILSSFGRIHGGLVRNNGGFINLNGMTLFNPGAGMTLQGVLTLETNQSMRLVNAIANEGTLRVRSTGSPSTVWLGEDGATSVTLTGNGDIKLGELSDFTGLVGLAENFGGATLTIADNLLHGFGNIGTGNRQLTIVNQDTVSADASARTLSVRAAAFNNTQGALRAENGGVLQLSVNTPIANVGSLIEARANSTVQFETGTDVSGGTLRNVNVTFNLNNGTFDLSNATLLHPGSGLTLQGAFIVHDAASARLLGTIRNEGKLQLRSSGNDTILYIGRDGTPNVSLVGGGDIILGDATLGATSARLDAGTVDASLSLDEQTLRGFGVVGYGFGGSNRYLHLTNNSLINADMNGKTLAFVPITLTNSPGKVIKATNGGKLYFNPASLTNTGASIQGTNASGVIFDATSITGGLVNSEVGGTIQFLNGLTASGGITFANAGETIIGGGNGGTQTFSGQNNGGSTFINSGTVTKVGAGDYSIFTSLNDTGAMVVGSGILRWFGGGTIANANFFAAAATDLTFQGAQPFTFSGSNILNGPGQHWIVGTAALADSATLLAATNFNFYNSALSGPGTISFSGAVNFAPYNNSSFSGSKLLNLAGSTGFLDTAVTLNFTNAAQWENRGAVTMSGYINTINGDATTLFNNTTSGILRGAPAQTNDFIMPYRNSGVFDVTGGVLHLKTSGTFANGSATIASGTELWVQDSAMTLDGQTNSATGLGFLQIVGSGSLALTPGSKLNVDRLQFNNPSSASGSGEVNIAKVLNFHPYYAPPAIMNGVSFNLAAAGTGLIQFDGGTLRFQNGARLNNAGQLSLRASSLIEFNSASIFENSGILNIYDSPTLTGDGTGLLRTLYESEMHFYASRTVNLPFDLAGRVYAEGGAVATFNQGGLFNETAKIWPNNPAAQITFTGAGPYRSRGQAVEFPGTGYVNFVDTTLQFEPSSITGDVTDINAGARVAFHGNNLIKSIGTHGTLSTTGFVFQSGDQIVDNTTLKTVGGDTSVWNATGRKLELKNGAQFLNTGLFVIQTRVGSLLNDPGIFGDATTLFHNTLTGRLIHDSNTQTDFAVDFQNDGVLEFRQGTFNFLRRFSGNGGIAASNGAQVNLSLVGVSGGMHPNLLQTIGAGSQINVTLAAGQVLSLNVDVNGGRMVAAGGLNMVAAGGLNLVAAGGGNIVAAGGMNLVAAGAGNMTAQGIASLLQANNLIGLDGGTMIGLDGGTLRAAGNIQLSSGASASLTGAQTRGEIAGLIGLDGGTLIGNDGSTLVAAGGMNVVNNGAAIAQGAGTLLQADKMIGLDGGTMIGLDGGTMVAAGSLNRKASRSASQTAVAGDPGTIVAGPNGTIRGNGTFQGAGFVQNGGRIQPGQNPGTLTWTGNLTIENGGLLEIEIGGAVAGSQYDVVNVSSGFTMNGTLRITLLNGFGSSVQPNDTFDIVTAGSPISTTLAGSRIPATGAYGTFEVQLVNNGRTLRLANYQAGPVTFSSWANRYGLSGANATPTADPNGNGLPNLIEYALGLDPTLVGGSRGITSGLIQENGQKYQSLSYTRPTGADAASDIIYSPERASTLLPPNWSSSVVDIISLGAVPGPGNLETVTVRSTHPLLTTPREFLHLKVTLQ